MSKYSYWKSNIPEYDIQISDVEYESFRATFYHFKSMMLDMEGLEKKFSSRILEMHWNTTLQAEKESRDKLWDLPSAGMSRWSSLPRKGSRKYWSNMPSVGVS